MNVNIIFRLKEVEGRRGDCSVLPILFNSLHKSVVNLTFKLKFCSAGTPQSGAVYLQIRKEGKRGKKKNPQILSKKNRRRKENISPKV